MHDTGYKSALARRACRYSDARPPRKTDGVLLESETPPRMRGKVVFCHIPVAGHGITPAYAGKRNAQRLGASGSRDHPRVCGEKDAIFCALCQRQGSPPRVRGKDCGVADMVLPVRITPAYAGKRRGRRHPACSCRDHPRICGEKCFGVSPVRSSHGSPPRMRGKRLFQHGRFQRLGSPPHMRGKEYRTLRRPPEHGITPAYAGKRSRTQSFTSTWQDHPRICGEKFCPRLLIAKGLGSPPHMRGKASKAGEQSHSIGITPAYAGKSQPGLRRKRMKWDHPRICGEKLRTRLFLCHLLGSPPHMRGKVASLFVFWLQRRDHPHICGEKAAECIDTGVKLGSPPRMRGKVKRQQATAPPGQDHPRVCGEKPGTSERKPMSSGLPPHMRGKAGVEVCRGLSVGITPAYAGKSPARPGPRPWRWDHPRICGEKQGNVAAMSVTGGSPPHMRGKGRKDLNLYPKGGITPAYAGKRAFSAALQRTL